MQIVIEIDARVYGLLKYFEKALGLNDKKDDNEDVKTALMRSVATGTPLPKGHGDLVDMSQLDSKMYHMAFETDTDLQKWDSGCWIRYKLYENIRDAMPVIIEADKVESEDM